MEDFERDMENVRRYRKAHFEVRVQKGRLDPSTIEVMVTHNGGQWHAIDMDSAEEANIVATEILKFLYNQAMEGGTS